MEHSLGTTAVIEFTGMCSSSTSHIKNDFDIGQDKLQHFVILYQIYFTFMYLLTSMFSRCLAMFGIARLCFQGYRRRVGSVDLLSLDHSLFLFIFSSLNFMFSTESISSTYSLSLHCALKNALGDPFPIITCSLLFPFL